MRDCPTVESFGCGQKGHMKNSGKCLKKKTVNWETGRDGKGRKGKGRLPSKQSMAQQEGRQPSQ